METFKNSGLVLAICLLLAGCVPDVGNPDLSGTWSCTETSQIFLKSAKGTSVFDVTFSRDAVNTDKYYLSNFYNMGSGFKVSVIKNSYTITLPKQSVEGIVFEGNGTINETYDLINMNYTADDGGGEVDHVTAEFSR
jgi:hypothetical protein